MKTIISSIMYLTLTTSSYSTFIIQGDTFYCTKRSPNSDPNVKSILSKAPENSSVIVFRRKNDGECTYEVAMPIQSKDGISFFRRFPMKKANNGDWRKGYPSWLYMCPITGTNLNHSDERFILVENIPPGMFNTIVREWNRIIENRDFEKLMKLDFSSAPTTEEFRKELTQNTSQLRIKRIKVDTIGSNECCFYSMEIQGKSRWLILFDIINNEIKYIGSGVVM